MPLKLAYTNDSDITADHWRVTRFAVEVGTKYVDGDPPVTARKNRIEVTVSLFKSKAGYNNFKHRVQGADRSYVWELAEFPFSLARMNNLIDDIEIKLLSLPEFAGAVVE